MHVRIIIWYLPVHRYPPRQETYIDRCLWQFSTRQAPKMEGGISIVWHHWWWGPDVLRLVRIMACVCIITCRSMIIIVLHFVILSIHSHQLLSKHICSNMPSKSKSESKRAMKMQQWKEYLESLSEEKICLSCWAEMLHEYLTQFPSNIGCLQNKLADLYDLLVYLKPNDDQQHMFWRHRIMFCFFVYTSHAWLNYTGIPPTPNLRREYAILLQVSRDCRCDFDWGCTRSLTN